MGNITSRNPLDRWGFVGRALIVLSVSLRSPRTRGSLSGMDFEGKRKSYVSNPFLITSHACGRGGTGRAADCDGEGTLHRIFTKDEN